MKKEGDKKGKENRSKKREKENCLSTFKTYNGTSFFSSIGPQIMGHNF